MAETSPERRWCSPSCHLASEFASLVSGTESISWALTGYYLPLARERSGNVCMCARRMGTRTRNVDVIELQMRAGQGWEER